MIDDLLTNDEELHALYTKIRNAQTNPMLWDAKLAQMTDEEIVEHLHKSGFRNAKRKFTSKQEKPEQVFMPTPKPVVEQVHIPASATTQYPADFEEFFAFYPFPNDKEQAYKAWNLVANERPSLDMLKQYIQLAEKYVWGDFKPFPHVFLLHKRWTDGEVIYNRMKNDENLSHTLTASIRQQAIANTVQSAITLGDALYDYMGHNVAKTEHLRAFCLYIAFLYKKYPFSCHPDQFVPAVHAMFELIWQTEIGLFELYSDEETVDQFIEDFHSVIVDAFGRRYLWNPEDTYTLEYKSHCITRSYIDTFGKDPTFYVSPTAICGLPKQYDWQGNVVNMITFED
jgi:hypothetical protein